MRTPALFLAAFLLAGPAAAAEPFCLSDRELMAEVAEGFLFEQGFKAAQCDALLAALPEPPKSRQADLHRAIAARFRAQFARHAKVREALYRRLYGKDWQLFMAKERKGKTRHLLLTLRLSEAECRRHGVALLFRNSAEWDFIQRKLARTFAAARRQVPVCE